MKTFAVGSNASRVSLRVYAQLPGDEIQDGDVIEILQMQSLLAQDSHRILYV
jgi:hypothetical protein